MGPVEVHDSISRRLRQARESRGMTQAEVARDARPEPSAVAHFERGRREPNARNLRSLCRALDVSADYLLGAHGHGRQDEVTMGWAKDGSGLLVYRGRTVRQTATPMCESLNARNFRRECGWFGSHNECARSIFTQRNIRKRTKVRRREAWRSGAAGMPF